VYYRIGTYIVPDTWRVIVPTPFSCGVSRWTLELDLTRAS